MANRIVSVHAGIYGIGIYAIMLPYLVGSCLLIHNGMSPLRETVIVTLGQNNQTIHAPQCETRCL